jgi:hypothetical protein
MEGKTRKEKEKGLGVRAWSSPHAWDSFCLIFFNGADDLLSTQFFGKKIVDDMSFALPKF